MMTREGNKALRSLWRALPLVAQDVRQRLADTVQTQAAHGRIAYMQQSQLIELLCAALQLPATTVLKAQT